MKRISMLFRLVCLLFFFSGCTGKADLQPPIAVDESMHQQPPKDVVPKDAALSPVYTDYVMNLSIDPVARVVSCVETISYKNAANTTLDRLYLRVYANSYSQDASHLPYLSSMQDAVYPNGLLYGNFQMQSLTLNNEPVSYSLADTVLEIIPKTPLAAGEEIEIKLMFEAYIPQSAHYLGGNDDAMWFGNLFPTLAVFKGTRWNTEPFPPIGYPVYHDVANYTLSMVLPKEYEVIAPGITSVTENGSDRVVNISNRMIRSFSFAIAKNYQAESIKTADGITVTLYSQNNNRETISHILQQAKDSLEFYTKKLGSYPYSTLLLLECPLAEGLEVGFSQLLFLDQQTDRTADFSAFHSLPVGFQWLPEIIGVNPHTDGWFFEGLIRFLSVYQKNPALIRSEMNTYYNELTAAYQQGAFAPPLHTPLSAFETFDQYALFYQKKSALFIYQLYCQMGDAAFFEALKTFYATYAFQFVSFKDFQSICEEVSGKDFGPLFDIWITQEGLPPLL